LIPQQSFFKFLQFFFFFSFLCFRSCEFRLKFFHSALPVLFTLFQKPSSVLESFDLYFGFAAFGFPTITALLKKRDQLSRWAFVAFPFLCFFHFFLAFYCFPVCIIWICGTYNRFSQKGIVYCRRMDTLKLVDKNGTKMVGFYDRKIAQIWLIFNTPVQSHKKGICPYR